MEDRVAALERAAGDSKQATDRLESDLASTKATLSDAIAHEGKQRKDDLSKLRTLVEEHAASGLTLDFVAVAWLLIGTIASTIPDMLPTLQVLACK